MTAATQAFKKNPLDGYLTARGNRARYIIERVTAGITEYYTCLGDFTTDRDEAIRFTQAPVSRAQMFVGARCKLA